MKLWAPGDPELLEELREAGIELPVVEVRSIDLSKGEQFTDEFTAANPKQKISVLIDGDQSIMESCAILQYLGEKYPRLQGMDLDVTARIFENSPNARSRSLRISGET